MCRQVACFRSPFFLLHMCHGHWFQDTPSQLLSIIGRLFVVSNSKNVLQVLALRPSASDVQAWRVCSHIKKAIKLQAMLAQSERHDSNDGLSNRGSRRLVMLRMIMAHHCKRHVHGTSLPCARGVLLALQSRFSCAFLIQPLTKDYHVSLLAWCRHAMLARKVATQTCVPIMCVGRVAARQHGLSATRAAMCRVFWSDVSIGLGLSMLAVCQGLPLLCSLVSLSVLLSSQACWGHLRQIDTEIRSPRPTPRSLLDPVCFVFPTLPARACRGEHVKAREGFKVFLFTNVVKSSKRHDLVSLGGRGFWKRSCHPDIPTQRSQIERQKGLPIVKNHPTTFQDISEQLKSA